MDIETKFELGIFFNDREFETRVGQIMEAGLFIIESEYVTQSPGNTGNLKQEIRTAKRGVMDYIVESRATSRGKRYPVFLHEGTGRLRGKADFGFTTGRVRGQEVAYGIGGIRPNKAADRTVKAVKGKYIDFIMRNLKKIL